jgi:integrase/recombinase XerD
VLSTDEARRLLDSIERNTICGLRDLAIISVMLFGFARIGAVLGMNCDDFFRQRNRFWFRLHEKGGKRLDLPAHPEAEAYVTAYLSAAGDGGKATPLFRTVDRKGRLTDRRMHRCQALAMVKRRASVAGLTSSICCHSFRATGITAYLLNGGTLEKVPPQCTPNTGLSRLVAVG